MIPGPAKVKVGKPKAIKVASMTLPKMKKPGPSHPHLKRTKLSVAGKSAFPAKMAFSPGVGGDAPFATPAGGPVMPPADDAPQDMEAGAPEAGGP